MSLKAIAQELGISITTVSRGLNGYSDVAEHTRQLIMAAAEARGYQPNASARRLKTGKTDAVGLVYPMTASALYDPNLLEIVSDITAALANFNIDVLMVSDRGHDGQFPYIRLIESGRVDALIVFDTFEDDPRVNYLVSKKHPFLACGRCNIKEPYAWFDFDCEIGSREAVKYLIDHQHRQIAYLGGKDHQAYVNQRKQGFIKQMSESDLELPPNYVIEANSNRSGGYAAMQQLLQLENRPTAVLIDHSMLGDGALTATIDAGLTPGKEISFIIYDGLPPDTLLKQQATLVQLSTSDQKSRQIADMVVALINGEASEKLQVLWPTTVIDGDTVSRLL
jgi:LacI family transcriptional regulator